MKTKTYRMIWCILVTMVLLFICVMAFMDGIRIGDYYKASSVMVRGFRSLDEARKWTEEGP